MGNVRSFLLLAGRAVSGFKELRRSSLNSAVDPEFPDRAVEVRTSQPAPLDVGSYLGDPPLQ